MKNRVFQKTILRARVGTLSQREAACSSIVADDYSLVPTLLVHCPIVSTFSSFFIFIFLKKYFKLLWVLVPDA